MIVCMYRYANNSKPNYTEDKAKNSRDVEKVRNLYLTEGFRMGWIYELNERNERVKKLAYFSKTNIEIY